MPWLLIVVLLIVACTIYLISTAPVGYQDDDGFHYGKPDDYDKDFF